MRAHALHSLSLSLTDHPNSGNKALLIGFTAHIYVILVAALSSLRNTHYSRSNIQSEQETLNI